jgi:hypothetical protein
MWEGGCLDADGYLIKRHLVRAEAAAPAAAASGLAEPPGHHACPASWSSAAARFPARAAIRASSKVKRAAKRDCVHAALGGRQPHGIGRGKGYRLGFLMAADLHETPEARCQSACFWMLV